MAQKVVEFYIETLKEYKKRLNKDKVTLLMQVGEFFEIYGLIYPDGKRVDFRNLNHSFTLKITEERQKNQNTYLNSKYIKILDYHNT